jgi:hypothetical protein
MESDLKQVDDLFVDLESKDDKVRYPAFKTLLNLTEVKVDWVYVKWYELLEKLESENSYQRSIGFMLLANLSKSDTDNRMEQSLKRLIELFDDEKFITSRQCIQNVWKIALGNKAFKLWILDELNKTYYENVHNKNHGNLIKQDVLFSMNKIYQSEKDPKVLAQMNDLIDAELDSKFVKVLEKIIR